MPLDSEICPKVFGSNVERKKEQQIIQLLFSLY